ncbi:hypothetical protein P167DRAFT_544132 [Morchella conica CCBAS932]|uniref:Uncharacterized protein n=1 Tax=Morchella conica CCBAS932 TaxID=1392247 RepID=A0A3N4KUG8_9PEZI|nr:hypothetical protein P167DRAFT_544132 [Morchella conica CCBAS932]
MYHRCSQQRSYLRGSNQLDPYASISGPPFSLHFFLYLLGFFHAPTFGVAIAWLEIDHEAQKRINRKIADSKRVPVSWSLLAMGFPILARPSGSSFLMRRGIEKPADVTSTVAPFYYKSYVYLFSIYPTRPKAKWMRRQQKSGADLYLCTTQK